MTVLDSLVPLPWDHQLVTTQFHSKIIHHVCHLLTCQRSGASIDVMQKYITFSETGMLTTQYLQAPRGKPIKHRFLVSEWGSRCLDLDIML